MGRNPGYLFVAEDVSVVTVGVNETLMTSFLVFFILCVGMEKTYENPLGPLAIGLTVFQGILSAYVLVYFNFRKMINYHCVRETTSVFTVWETKLLLIENLLYKLFTSQKFYVQLINDVY